MTDAARALEQRLEEAARPPTVGVAGHSKGRPRSWMLIGAVITAFAVGGAAVILHIWPLLWACVAVAVLAVPAGLAMGVMDDTVTWHDPLPEAADNPGRVVPQPSDITSPPPSPPLSLPPPPPTRSSPSPQPDASFERPSEAPSEARAPSDGDDAPAHDGARRSGFAAVPVAVAAVAAVVAGWLIRRRKTAAADR